ncbi:MAG: PduL/EutD family phosphate acyltransferase, partial [Patescibacteria group bacterium]
MKKIKVKIEVSSRHLHVDRKDLDKLFGKNYELTPFKKLSQKGEFSAKETVTLKNGSSEIQNVRIVGPVRTETQVELSLTDAYKLKIKPPVRISGDIKKSVGTTLIGPKGKIVLKEGVIIAARHIHLSAVDAKKYSLKNGQWVYVQVPGKRGVIFENV